MSHGLPIFASRWPRNPGLHFRFVIASPSALCGSVSSLKTGMPIDSMLVGRHLLNRQRVLFFATIVKIGVALQIKPPVLSAMKTAAKAAV